MRILLICQSVLRGLTEEIQFSEDGLRIFFYIELLELSRNNETGDVFRKTAIYDKNGLQLLRNFSNLQEETSLSMQNKIFKVILREGMPFLRKKYATFKFSIDFFDEKIFIPQERCGFSSKHIYKRSL